MAQDFVAGWFGGCAGVAVGHPFDTIKVRIQTQDYANPKYRGAWHCFTHTVQNESVRGLFRGMSSPMAGVAAVNAILFGVHGNVTRLMKDPDSLRSQVIAGSAAGFVQAFVTSPMELLKTRLQLQESSASTSPIECARRIIRSEGLKGLFRGQMITIGRDVPAFATYFFTYEYLTKQWAGDDGLPGAPAVLMAGGLAGVASWIFTYPIDVIKTRLQCDGISGSNKYKGVLHCAKVGIAEEGFSSLTRGLAPTLLRAFPVNAATFAVVTATLRMFPDQEDMEMSNAWKEIMTLGDGLVSAVNTPEYQQFMKKHEHPFNACMNLLPQVEANTKMNVEHKERLRHTEASGHENSHRSEPHAYLGLWSTYDQLISGRRNPLMSLHRHHHNLSNTL